MKPHKVLSIKNRLVLAFSAMFAVFLILLGTIVISLYRQSQLQTIDTFLRTEATGIAATIREYYTQALSTAGKGESKYAVFLEKIAEYMHVRANKPAMYRTTLYIFNELGQVLSSSNEALRLNLLDQNTVHSSKVSFEAIGIDSFFVTIQQDQHKYRMLQMPVIPGTPDTGFIRIASLLDGLQANQLDFTFTIVLVLGAIVAALVIGGYLLATWTLKPVITMSHSVQQISTDKIDRRLPLLPGHDELSRLALTFNHMLDRVMSAYVFQEHLVNDLSHQLRTPLTILRGTIELELSKENDTTTYRKTIEDALAGIDRISTLLNTILSMASLDSRSARLQSQTGSLLLLLRDTIADLAPLWDERDIHFDYSISSMVNQESIRHNNLSDVLDNKETYAAFCIPIDHARLCQALTNILDNAYKYVPVGGTISIFLDSNYGVRGEFCRLTISNNGPPIPASALPRVFERFFHVDTTGGTGSLENVGVGLGLSIAKGIIELHRGSIRAHNPAGGGAAFEILLPRRKNSAAL